MCLSPEPLSERSFNDSDLVSSEAEDEHRPLQTLSSKGKAKDKLNRDSPSGIILLGRGNSFSLGRSEVILLPQRRKKPASGGDKGDKNNNDTTGQNSASPHSPYSPPP